MIDPREEDFRNIIADEGVDVTYAPSSGNIFPLKGIFKIVPKEVNPGQKSSTSERYFIFIGTDIPNPQRGEKITLKLKNKDYYIINTPPSSGIFTKVFVAEDKP